MKLLVTEPGSDLAHDAAEAAELLASSEVAYVETRSALARMRAGDRLDALGHERQRSAFERLWSHMAVVAVDTVALTRAAQLSERHVLRACDAVHLASALEVAGAAPLTFACWDRELLDAAESEGLAALR